MAIPCPFCNKDFSDQCAHLLAYVNGVRTFTGRPDIDDMLEQICGAMLTAVRLGHHESPVAELRDPYRHLSDDLSDGESERDALLVPLSEVSVALIDLCRNVDETVSVTNMSRVLEVNVPQRDVYLNTKGWLISKRGRYAVFQLSSVLWSRTRDTTYELLRYEVAKWIREFSGKPAKSVILEKYFPITAKTERSFPAEMLGAPHYLIPWDLSADGLLRTLRIALRALGEGRGPMAHHDSDFLQRLNARRRINWLATIKILVRETPDIVASALPHLKEAAAKADQLIPKIGQMAMPSMSKVNHLHRYTRLVDFAREVEAALAKSKIEPATVATRRVREADHQNLPQTPLQELRAMTLRRRLIAVARDIETRTDRFRDIAPHALADALGVPDSRKPDGDWSYTRYTKKMTVEDYSEICPAHEIVDMLEPRVPPERVEELVRLSSTFVSYERAQFNFLTAEERSWLEDTIASERYELNATSGLCCIAHYTVDSDLCFEAVVEDDGACVELRTPYDCRDGRFQDLDNCVTDSW